MTSKRYDQINKRISQLENLKDKTTVLSILQDVITIEDDLELLVLMKNLKRKNPQHLLTLAYENIDIARATINIAKRIDYLVDKERELKDGKYKGQFNLPGDEQK
jgi:hypothetical protein